MAPGPANRGGDEPGRYEPEGNGADRVSLAVVRSEVVHGFRHVDRRLEGIEDTQATQGKEISDLKTCFAVLDATAIKSGAVKLGMIIGGAVTIVLGVATVITKVAGLW